MARYFDVHPVDPQARSIAQVAALLRDDAQGGHRQSSDTADLP